MATYTDKFSSGWAELQLVVTRDSYSTANNTSYLKCVLKIKKLANASSYNFVDASISMTIAGKKLYSSKEFDIRSLSVGSTKTLATKYITVSHNSDGTKSVSCKANFDSGVGLGDAYISTTYTCGTIPRASSLSLSTTSVNVGSTITANISRKSTNFVHDVEFFISGWGLGSQDGINKGYYRKYTGVTTSRDYKIPTSWYNYMSESTSCTAWCRITTRDSSGNQIGSKAEASFTAKVPTSIVPTVGTITFNPWNITIKGGTEKDILVQGKNKFTLSVSGCVAGTGSSIKSYTFSGPGLTTTTQTGGSIEGGPVSNTGNLTYTVKVTDKRGRTASKTISGSSNRAYCYAYSKPYISSFSIYKARKNSDDSYTADNNGTYLKCDYNPVYSKISGNNAFITMHYTTGSTEKSKTGSSGSVVVDGINPDSTYKVYLTIEDNYGGTGTSATKTILGTFRTINVHKNGKGIAFGKKSEEACFECAWTSRFYGSIFMEKNDTGLYATTADDKNARLLNLSSNNNVLISNTDVANCTYIHGGTDKTVSIGSNGYKSNLYVSGTASGPSGFSTSSDKKVKKNIKNLDVDIVDKLQSVEYQLVDSIDDKTHYGFVAQDVIQTLINAGINPETCGIVGTIQNGDEQQYVLTYTEFIPLLVTKCQTLQSEVDELRQEMAELKRLIT